jgi:hypothetical protein
MTEPNPIHLCETDRQAIDALIEHRLDAAAVPHPHSARCKRISSLLGLLDHLPAPSCGDLLAARTLQSVQNATACASHTSSAGPEAEAYHLSPADEQAIDALVAHGFESANVSADLRPRADLALNLLGTLDSLPAPSTGDLLVVRTLQTIQKSVEQQRLSQQIERLAVPGSGGLSLRELVAVAAMFMIGISLMWPMLSSARSTSRQVACSANLAAAGMGLTSYAADFRGAMPAVAANLGDPWWLTNEFNSDGTAKSNSAHLFQAALMGHVALSDLRCPENLQAPTQLTAGMRDWPTNAAASFSYQNQYAQKKPKLDGSVNMAILADKNPFFQPGKYNLELRQQLPFAGSPNHLARGGQNVLLTTGEVAWMTKPLLDSGDNIFHVGSEGLDYYTGREGPADVSDSFLVP